MIYAQETCKPQPQKQSVRMSPLSLENSIHISSPHLNLIGEPINKNYEQIVRTTAHERKSENRFLQILARKFLLDEFKSKLLSLSSTYRYKTLKNSEIELIETLDQLSKIDQQAHFIIKPASPIIILWNIIMNIIILLLLFLLTITYSFQMNLDKILNITYDGVNAFNILIEVLLCLDVLFHLNTGYIFQGQIILSRKKVIHNYLKTQLHTDFIGLLTVQIPLIYSNEAPFILFVISLIIFTNLKLKYLNKTFNEFRDFLNLTEIQNLYLDLIILIAQIVMIGHLFACIWYGISTVYYNDGINWINFYHFADKDLWSKYNVSFYWAAMTMITVGYGDIIPQNDIERLVCNFTMFLGCGVFAFSINKIGSVLASMQKATEDYNRSKTIINQYMRKYNIENDLQNRIRSCLEFQLIDNKQNENEIKEVISLLSPQLQRELKEQSQILQIKKIDSLKLFSSKLKRDLAHKTTDVAFGPGDLILSPLVKDDNSLYYILDGQVEFYAGSQNKQQIFKVGSTGQSFGEYGFYTGFVRTCSIRSKGYTRLLKIQRSEFLQICQNELDKELLSIIKSDMQHFNIKRISQQCFNCQQNHYIIHCPNLHLSLNKDTVIKKQYYPMTQSRSSFYNRRQIRSEGLICLNVIQQQIAQYQLQDSEINRLLSLNIKQDGPSEDSLFMPQPQTSKKIDDGIIESNQNIRAQLDNPTKRLSPSRNTFTIQANSSSRIQTYLKSMEQFHIIPDFDKLAIFKLKPWFNYKAVISRLKGQNKKSVFLRSNYTFNYKAMLKTIQIREKLND